MTAPTHANVHTSVNLPTDTVRCSETGQGMTLHRWRCDALALLGAQALRSSDPC